MKALTDKIMDCLIDRQSKFIGSLKDKETQAESRGYKLGLSTAVEIVRSLEDSAEFEEIARVMMKHLGNRTDLYCPHHYVYIDITRAELLQGQHSTGIIKDYIKD